MIQHLAPPREAPSDPAGLRSPIGPGPPQPGAVLCCFRRSVPSRARPARLVEPPIGLVWVVILATHGPCFDHLTRPPQLL